MASKKPPKERRTSRKAADGLLATAARTVGTVAGKIAAGLGIGTDNPPTSPQPPQKQAAKKKPSVKKRAVVKRPASKRAKK